ncbi:MAG: hypothetical protein H6686_01130 [Fibrobacteria bacterium]|nr:hypothetical protein [Fibrobacteria bacterium]
MILVLGLTLVLLAMGTMMLTTSGNILSSAVDSKQRIRSRYAAEAMVALSIARAVEKASHFFGKSLDVENMPMAALGTGSGEKGASTVVNRVDPTSPLSQEPITSGRLRGMQGLKIPLLIKAEGLVPGGGKSRIEADVRLYQVPLFQFGVFYEGDLEITPGPNMFVLGPVHTNSNAYFRGIATLQFQGPVTAAGTIWHWMRSSSGRIRYFQTPDISGPSITLSTSTPGVTTSMTELSAATKPGPVDGVWNIDDHREKLVLPIGGAQPRNLIALKSDGDGEELRFQNFDWKASPTSRFVNGVTVRPSWITGPRVFFDRREDRWVKLWNLDIQALIASGNRDSIFFLADTVLMAQDRGSSRTFLLNAFRIVNGEHLPRNMTIASANPIYIQGDFNLPDPSGPCKPADLTGTIPNDQKYCNAQIAADAVTLLSPNWPHRSLAEAGKDGSLEQDSAEAVWNSYQDTTYWWGGRTITTKTFLEPTTGAAGAFNSGTVRVNAAILTGNKPSRDAAHPPLNKSESGFEANYEGGWHNTIRFLENLSGATVEFNGSFVCMWKAASRGLDTTSNISISGGHYSPPNRVWGFDPRFRNLNNMPPGTPFLATAIFTNWLEKR